MNKQPRIVIVLLGLTATRSTPPEEAAILDSALAWSGAECDWFGGRPAVSSLIRGNVSASRVRTCSRESNLRAAPDGSLKSLGPRREGFHHAHGTSRKRVRWQYSM